MTLKNFCILPFIHFATTTEGQCRLCCKVSKHDVIRDNNGVPYNVNTHSIDEIWNSNHYREIRSRILKDEKLEECSICFKEEETFYSAWNKDTKDELPSKRRKENQKWLHVEKTKLKDSINSIVTDPTIKYFDIRLSNLCNLKCRMCWPHFSSQIVKEQQQFNKQGLPTHYKHYNVDEWNTQKLWKSIDEQILHIEEITFVGGEPTLHEDMYNLLDKLVEKGYSKNIRLKITSNLTNIQQRLIESFKSFKSVVINGSIDGIEEFNDYIRHPSDWKTINKNIDKLLLIDDLKLNLTPVIQIYNIFNLRNLIEWYVKKWIKTEKGENFLLSLDLLYDPNYLSVKLLNTYGKEKWYWNTYVPTIEYLDNILADITSYPQEVQNYWKILDTLRRRIVNIALYTESVGYDESGKLQYWFSESKAKDIDVYREKCKKYTQQLDKHRNQNIENIMKDFYEVIK